MAVKKLFIVLSGTGNGKEDTGNTLMPIKSPLERVKTYLPPKERKI